MTTDGEPSAEELGELAAEAVEAVDELKRKLDVRGDRELRQHAEVAQLEVHAIRRKLPDPVEPPE